MNRQTALSLIAAIGNREITAEEAPAELWTWISEHVALDCAEDEVRAVITD